MTGKLCIVSVTALGALGTAWSAWTLADALLTAYTPQAQVVGLAIGIAMLAGASIYRCVTQNAIRLRSRRNQWFRLQFNKHSLSQVPTQPQRDLPSRALGKPPFAAELTVMHGEGGPLEQVV